MRVSWNGFQSNLAPQIEQYLRAKRAMGCKFACEDRQLRLLDRFLAHRCVESIEAIDAQCLQEFLDSRQRTNPRSYNNLLGDVRRLFEWIASQQIPGPSPVTIKAQPQTARRLPYLFSDETIRLLLTLAAALPDNSRAPQRGILYEMMHPPLRLREAITSRIKILAKLDIAEKRLPQDGRIKIKTKIQDRIKDLDFRVSVLPTIYGEKIVMRLLDKDNLMLDMTRLGFEAESLRKFEQAILKPYGMVLVTGPTGSGKTNTLYSALQRVNTAEVNIITAEDPVEFNLPGINQVQMKEQIGLNFAAALRSFLRQDPNIILVGEIRDFETAEVAIKAAMTGHLVLSTLHTNDAPSSINRLMNMGIEPFLVATSNYAL